MKVVALLLLVGCATAARPVDADVERAFYARVVDGLQGHGDPVAPDDVDYARFRRAAALARAEEDPSLLARQQAALRAAGDRAAAGVAAEALLASDFADAGAHLEVARRLHPTPAATFHEAVALGLLQSILASGDGSGQRPYRAFGAREEEALAAFLDLRIERRTQEPRADCIIDIVDARDPRGRARRVFFDITPPPVKPPEAGPPAGP
jgi:hypothetical protein